MSVARRFWDAVKFPQRWGNLARRLPAAPRRPTETSVAQTDWYRWGPPTSPQKRSEGFVRALVDPDYERK